VAPVSCQGAHVVIHSAPRLPAKTYALDALDVSLTGVIRDALAADLPISDAERAVVSDLIYECRAALILRVL